MALSTPTTPGFNTGLATGTSGSTTPTLGTSPFSANPTNPLMPPSNPAASKPASQQPVITSKPAVQSNQNMVTGTANVNNAVNTQLSNGQSNPNSGTAPVTNDSINKLIDSIAGTNTSSTPAAAVTPPVTPPASGTTDTSGTSSTPISATDQAFIDQGNKIVSDEQASLKQVNDQIQSNSDSYQSALAEIQNGTFPLSPAQQAQINSTSAMFQNLANLQTQANQAYTQSVAVAADRSGSLATDPTSFVAGQHEAISNGLQKIQNLDVQASQQLATLNASFQTQDLGIIKDSYDALNTTLEDKSKNISDLASTALSQLNSTRDYTQKVQEDALTQLMDNNTISYQAKQLALQQSTLDEKTKTDLQTIADEQEQNKINAANEAIAQGTYNATYGQFMNTDGTLNTSVQPQNIPGYSALGNGSAIINGGNLPSKITETGIEQIGGIPVIKAADVPIVNAWGSAVTTVNKLLTELPALQDTNDPVSRADLASLNADLTTLGGNANFSSIGKMQISREGSPLMNAIDGGDLTKQLNQLRDTLNNSIQGINPYISVPVFGQTFTSLPDAKKYADSTGNTQAFNTLLNEYPSAQDLMDAINTGKPVTNSNPQQ